MTVKPDSLNDAVREVIANAKQAAGDNRKSQYLKDALAEAKAQVDRLKAALQRAESVLALPEGDPRRLGAVEKAREDRARYKGALADATDLQFEIENWISGKTAR
jgi:hypothetical protein